MVVGGSSDVAVVGIGIVVDGVVVVDSVAAGADCKALRRKIYVMQYAM